MTLVKSGLTFSLLHVADAASRTQHASRMDDCLIYSASVAFVRFYHGPLHRPSPKALKLLSFYITPFTNLKKEQPATPKSLTAVRVTFEREDEELEVRQITR